MHAPQAADFLPMNLETFSSHLDRVLPLFSALLAEFHNLPIWSLFWFVVAVGVAYLLGQMRNPGTPVLLNALFVPIVLYLLIYVFSSWPNYLEHVGLWISRLLLPVAPVGSLIILLAVSRRSVKSHAHVHQLGVTCTMEVYERKP